MADVLLTGDVAPFIHKTALCLASAGHRVHVLTTTRATSLRMSRHVTSTHHVPGPVLWGHRDGFVDAVDRAAASCGVDVVFPTGVAGARAIRRSERMPAVAMIPLPSLEALEICDDKGRFATVLAEAGIPQPAEPVLRSRDDADDLDGHRYPVMVKPPRGGGGVGVHRCDDPSELRAALLAGDGPLLVQEFVPGEDIDLSFLACEGTAIACTIQQRRHLDDHEMVFVDHDQVRCVGAELLDTLGYEGLGHADLRLDARDGSVKVIEVNPRVWGSVQYSMWMGVNFPAMAVELALGGTPSAPPGVPVGECTNAGLSASGIARRLSGRGAPAGLCEATRRSWETNHGDPLPFLAQKAGTGVRGFVSRASRRRTPR